MSTIWMTEESEKRQNREGQTVLGWWCSYSGGPGAATAMTQGITDVVEYMNRLVCPRELFAYMRKNNCWMAGARGSSFHT